MGRIKRGFEALQEALVQPVETVTRSTRINISGSDVDEIDPPEDIDELYDLYKETGIIRSNINQFVSDVTKPGARVEADSDQTRDFFMGGDAAPNFTPEGGFMENCFVYAGEKEQPFGDGLSTTLVNKWVRGTDTVEYLKANPDSADSEITGFYHIRPETLTAQVKPYTNILLEPDDTDVDGAVMTRRDEVAAYIQFDDESILGRRVGFEGRDSIPLSQNDVMKQVLDPDIGGDDTSEEGIFGESILTAVNVDATEYNEIKRDRARAIKTKAYGLWDASFEKQVHDLGNEIEITEWNEESINEWIDDVDDIGPGDIVGHDGAINLQRFPSEVPQLEGVLDHYVDDITSPLPAPKYSIGFEKNINQFVTERQEARYDELVDDERENQEAAWTKAFKRVAESYGLDTSGLKLVIAPQEDDSPVRSLSDEEIERIKVYTDALETVFGSGGAPSYVAEDVLRELILQLPEDSEPEEPEGEELPDMTTPQNTPPPQEAGNPQMPVGDGENPDEETAEEVEAQFNALLRGYDTE